MKTTLGSLALAGVLAAGGIALLRPSGPTKLVYQSPGQDSTAPAPGGKTVRGRVTRDGAPVAGARVRLVPANNLRHDTLVTSPLTLAAETDGDGRFEIHGAPDGLARLAVIADRLAPAVMDIDAASNPNIAIEMNAGIALEGLVAAADAPVAGARVSIRLVGRDSELERRPLREGVTDAEGRFRIEGLDPARAIRLVILAEAHRPYEKSFKSPLDAPERIDLESGIRISGRIVSTTGEPVAGVEVQASQGEGYTAGSRSLESGEVRIGGLLARPTTIRVLGDGFAPAKLELSQLASGWTITVRRHGGVAGRGPAGSWLVIETTSATYRRALGADGSFRWEGLPPGPAEARATDSSGRVLASKKIEIPEGGVADGIRVMP